MLCFLKNSSLALGPASYPSSQGLASSTSSLLQQQLSSSLNNLCSCPDQLGLMPLVFGVQQLPPVTSDVSALLHQPCERFFVCFQYLDLIIIREMLVIRFPAMCVYQVLVKC